MKPKDWFVVGVRLIGVYWLTEAAQEFIFLINTTMGHLRNYSPQTYEVHAIANLLIAIALIWGAVPLAAMVSWGDDRQDAESDIQVANRADEQ